MSGQCLRMLLNSPITFSEVNRNLQARSPSPTGGVVGPTGRPKPAGPRPQGSSAKRVRSRDLEESELDARDPKIHIHFGSFLKKVAGVLIREEGGGEVFSRAVEFDGLD